MSLLMQALKKAERAKQNALPDDEQDKPSEAFDELLALTPEPAQSVAPAPVPKREFNLDALSLEPLAGEAPAPAVAASSEPRPSPSPLPAASDHKEPGMTLDFALDPSDPVNAAAASPAASAATAAASGAAPAAAGHGSAAAALPADDAGLAPAPSAQAAAPRAAAAASAAAASAAAPAAKPAATGNGPQASAGGKSAASPAGGDKPRAAARARARAAATAEPTGMDPERLRLIGLIALVVLLVGGFGIYYWRALNGPGADLPPVPMPPPGATGATPAQVVVAALGPGATPPAAPADSDDPMLAPSGVNRAAQQALEQRIAKTEEELAAARASIQAAVAAAAAPRPEQLPPLQAPDNGEIRVARSMQASTVAPVLDGAYSAFNSGDLPTAQQQYNEALNQDPNNRDALLGAAAVAARQGQKDQAAAFYLRLLELSPNDGAATAGLVGLRQGDISRSEARLKAILATNPEAAPVLFALGNLYAQQGRWPDAQQAYFRANGAAPDNPDYAYNLAVGLDRLNQPKLALTYYQRALALAQDKAVGFDRNALRKRLHELSNGTIAH